MRNLLRSGGYYLISGWARIKDDVYYDKGHTWLKIEDGFARIGINDFAQKLIGPITEIVVPSIGQKIERGKPSFEIRFRDNSLTLVAPIDGHVVKRNEKVITDPTLINRDPYGEGWIVIVSPLDLESSIKLFFSPELAAVWMNQCFEILRKKTCEFIQDGGNLLEGVLETQNLEKRDILLKEFFSSGSS
ncbi:MAG: glycine cleavage system protein H [Deltaproteobacteria bacterium]|nr:glycine cleavage system protein H [Deltaproteobacteria bacterium]